MGDRIMLTPKRVTLWKTDGFSSLYLYFNDDQLDAERTFELLHLMSKLNVGIVSVSITQDWVEDTTLSVLYKPQAQRSK